MDYNGINGGMPDEALRSLTGMPVATTLMSKTSDSELWNTIKSN